MLKQLIARGAIDWNLSEKMTLFIMSIPFIVCFIGAGTALLGKPAYKWFTGEDQFAENLQVIFWILTFVLCISVIRRLWKLGDKGIAALYLVLLAGIFFLVGEELSWGQRIFGWETSESLKEINKQKETNIHNIYGVGTTFKWFHLVIGIYGTFLPLLLINSSANSPHRHKLEWLVPHYTMITYFAIPLVWRLYRNLLDPPKEFYFVVSEYSEVIELVLAIGFFVFMIYQLRRPRTT